MIMITKQFPIVRVISTRLYLKLCDLFSNRAHHPSSHYQEQQSWCPIFNPNYCNSFEDRSTRRWNLRVPRSSNELQRLDNMIGYQGDSSKNVHQVICPILGSILLGSSLAVCVLQGQSLNTDIQCGFIQHGHRRSLPIYGKRTTLVTLNKKALYVSI